MKIGLFNFSGRYNKGNCSKIIDYIDHKCKAKEIVTSHIQITFLSILPCCNCNYECFTTFCPLQDDLKMSYNFIIKNDIIFFVLPVYSSAPPATYFAWRERSQSIFSEEELYKEYSKVKKVYIVIGNADSGGENALRIVKEGDDSVNSEFILLENHKYGLSSISGKLIEEREVKNIIDTLLCRLITKDG